ncbi:MAG: BCD family MFS transporter [Spirulinaceae cyanobacterium SM2_1_0]|nr:BCD family MFS transporter [Spirulinaceae cyanobacterium SM2_1_0]
MTTRNFSEPAATTAWQPTASQLHWLTIARLGLFNLGLGLMSVLTVAVLNRVMISEIGIPGWITAGVVAMPYFVAPARVWFGQCSDARPLLGSHRAGYVWLGTATFGLAVFAIVQIVWQLGGAMAIAGGWVWNSSTLTWTLLLALLFALYGLAVSASSTPFTAMLVDISDERTRPRLISVVWSMLMVGIVIGGISGTILLPELPETLAAARTGIAIGGLSTSEFLQQTLTLLRGPLNRIFAVAPLLVLALALAATWGIERRYSLFSRRSAARDREDSITLGNALRVLTASRQTGLFFSFLLVLTLSLFLQEAVLEPYGGQVFQMPIGETTGLNAIWGMGILISYALTGFLVIPRLGKRATTKLGCVLLAVSFTLIILAGFTQEAAMLKAAMFIFGLAAGVATIGAISLMLDLTADEAAGTFIGAWGLSQALARAIAIWCGGILLDLGKILFQATLPAYSLVFGLQAVGAIAAIWLLERVSVKEFKESTRQAIATAMESELDG